MIHIRKRFRKPANIRGFIVKPGYYEVVNEENKIGYSSGCVKGDLIYCYFFEPIFGKWVSGWYVLSDESLKRILKDI